jgi:hypothetical protein
MIEMAISEDLMCIENGGTARRPPDCAESAYSALTQSAAHDTTITLTPHEFETQRILRMEKLLL